MGTVDLIACALDPALLFEDAAGGAPDEWQSRILRGRHRRLLLCCSRQAGKSTVAAVLALHDAVYRPGSLILLLSPSQRQSGEIFRKLLNAYRVTGEAVPPVAESTLALELANGSRVVSLPGKEGTVRSFSGVNLLVIDEAARVSDDLYRSVRPMLAVSGGRLAALSTPFGKRGWFFEEWTGDNEWEKVQVTAEECPRISAEFLEEEKKAMGPRWYAQEYLCSFEEDRKSVV